MVKFDKNLVDLGEKREETKEPVQQKGKHEWFW
jgi:hypothetical protein